MKQDQMSRVLHGGSWYDRQGHARSTFRNWFNPNSRNVCIGFRVLCANQSVTCVLRGGSWLLDQDYARSAFRNSNDPNYRFNLIGFRVLKDEPN